MTCTHVRQIVVNLNVQAKPSISNSRFPPLPPKGPCRIKSSFNTMSASIERRAEGGGCHFDLYSSLPLLATVTQGGWRRQ